MENIYFTFGSDPEFPYSRGEYVLIQCAGIGEACKLFKALHPNRPKSNTLNCAGVYNETQWKQCVRQYYDGKEPVEKITVTGSR